MPGDSKKRKHVSLSIEKKVMLLKEYEKGTPVNNICKNYDVGKSTVYDIIKQKEKILQFFTESVSKIEMKKRKTLRTPNSVDLDSVLIEWIRQKRSENIPLTGDMIVQQAKIFHEQMEIDSNCNYSSGWLEKFKKRHGIRQLRICGEKASADDEASELFVEEFSEKIINEKISHELIYNADETSLFWRYVPRKTLATSEEKSATGIKDIKERLTVLACANAAGSHKLKLLVVGKSKKPRCLKGISVYPVVYRANKRAWITKDLFQEWFENYFIPQARAHCISKGLPEESKIVLILDNCSAHPDPAVLNKKNVEVIFLPPNCTSLIQPMDMGVLNAVKCRYKNDFLRKMLNYVNDGKNVTDFVKEFNVKDALWSIANAWANVTVEILKNAWHNVLPTMIFDDDDDDGRNDFEGFKISQKESQTQELLEFASKRNVELDELDIQEVLDVDEKVPIVASLTDSEIINSVLKKKDDSDDDESEPESAENEKVSTGHLIEALNTVITGLEQRNFISEHEIMAVYRIREKVVANKPKMRQQTLNEMFK